MFTLNIPIKVQELSTNDLKSGIDGAGICSPCTFHGPVLGSPSGA
jgi:hypothetical protein